MRLNLSLIFSLLLVFLIFYLSWTPQPKLGLNWFIPHWLAAWTDAQSNDTIRTGVPFVFLGIFAGIRLSLISTRWYSWLLTWFMLILIVIIAEAGQIFLPHRFFDWRDVAWGALGAFVGLAVAFIGTAYRNLIPTSGKRKFKS